MSKTSRQIVAENLSALMERTRAYRSQPKVAEKSKVSQSTIGRILRKEVDAGGETLQAIAQVFRLTAADLLNPNLLEKMHNNQGLAPTEPFQAPQEQPAASGPLESSLMTFFRNLDPKRQAKLVAIAADLYAERKDETSLSGPPQRSGTLAKP